jgi:hypothetical protein
MNGIATKKRASLFLVLISFQVIYYATSDGLGIAVSGVTYFKIGILSRGFT